MSIASSIASRIRTIPDYPKPGILFRDITTLLKDPIGLQLLVREFVSRYREMKIDKVVGVESRGFIIGAPIAYGLGAGFVPIRKKGKLPAETISQDYILEYGEDRIEIHADAISHGERVLLIDDLIATGGTALASVKLLEKLNATVLEAAFIVNLPDLGGMQKLQQYGLSTFAIVEFPGH